MSHDDSSDPNLHIVADLDAFGVIVFQVRTFVNVHILTDLNTAQAMQSHAQGRAR